jgi:hypothetical protein
VLFGIHVRSTVTVAFESDLGCVCVCVCVQILCSRLGLTVQPGPSGANGRMCILKSVFFGRAHLELRWGFVSGGLAQVGT